MPEYLAPGVYVEETSFRSKSIEGVSTEAVDGVSWAARTPGSGCNGEISFTLSAEAARNRTAETAPLGSLLRIPSAEEGAAATLYVKGSDGWKSSGDADGPDDIP